MIWKPLATIALLLAGSVAAAQEVAATTSLVDSGADHSRDLQAADAALVDDSADHGRDLQSWGKKHYDCAFSMPAPFDVVSKSLSPQSSTCPSSERALAMEATTQLQGCVPESPLPLGDRRSAGQLVPRGHAVPVLQLPGKACS